MPNIRILLQSLADALSPDTGTSDGFVDNVETSLARISQALPEILGGKIEAESLAAEYDDQATYDIGDYCTHNGVLYICATAVTTAESWDSAKWVAIPLIEKLKEKLDAPADGAVAGRYLMVGQNGEPVWDQLDESDIRQSVYDWMSAHPEAIVVNDGTITRAKLDNSVGQAVDEASELKADFSELDKIADVGYLTESVVANGSFGAGGLTTGHTNRIRTDFIRFSAGDVITIENGTFEHACGIWTGDVASRETNIRNDSSFYTASEKFEFSYAGLLVVVFRKSSNANISPSEYDGEIRHYTDFTYKISNGLLFFDNKSDFVNGYFYNVTAHGIRTDASYSYVRLFVGLLWGSKVKGQTSVNPNSPYGIGFVDEYGSQIAGYYSTNTGSYIFDYELTVPEGAKWMYISCRNAGISDGTWQNPTCDWSVAPENITYGFETTGIEDHRKKLSNARLVPTTATAPLTLMHFSDIHADSNTLNRIMADVAKYDNVSGYICTGDMVANTYGQITSWWDSSVMTCIGNHDSASYNSSTGYNWTALSMADRDAYYIAPFEENWGINHSAGTSYYYKDYTDQKVRLIVMDAMLYNGTPGAEAAEQTAWLSNLLDDAITNSLHVLIAIHAPHGGATPEECTFTEYGTTQMPVLNDCNAPQTVIDTVASKITAGLHFVGYLCGHTHRDVVWDAENNGSQLMFAVTCANQTINSWKNTDLYRGPGVDAYNLVTIDTTNTLVKLLRFGGADFTKNMTPRKAICFNYTTGEKVGEVL